MKNARDAAVAVGEFLDALREEFGPELAQRVTVAATPVIVAVMLTEGEK